jgi:hypothetical protein
MKLALAFIFLSILPLLGLSQELKGSDETERWNYPYRAADDKRQDLLDVLKDFKGPIRIGDLFKRIGSPDRIDDLSKETKPLSHFESGFMDATKDRYSFRCIWFVRKTSRSPGLSDSWLAAYVDKNGRTVSVVHSNYLDPSGSGNGTGASGYGQGNGRGAGSVQSSAPVGELTKVKILSKPAPSYTGAACRDKILGTVIIRVTFLASGQIGFMSAVKGLSHGLTEQALGAAKRIVFEPAKLNGSNVSVVKLVEYNFNGC